MVSNFQKTIKEPIEFEGVGLHNGAKVKLCLKPAEINSGIKFKRTDIDSDKNIIDATYKNVISPILCTKIKNSYNVSVSTIEHLMAVFYGEGIDNVLVEVNESEIPIMDGSAFDFATAIRSFGVVEQNAEKKFIKVLKKVELKDGPKYISIEPLADDLVIDSSSNATFAGEVTLTGTSDINIGSGNSTTGKIRFGTESFERSPNTSSKPQIQTLELSFKVRFQGHVV